MGRILNNIKCGFVVLVFGVALPVIAFFNAYPGGVKDLVNRVQYSYTFAQLNPPKDVHVGQVFKQFDMTYIGAEFDLTSAKKGDALQLVITDNWGGDGSVLDSLIAAVNKSKAFVAVTVKRFGLSCGTYILGYGNILILPNDSLLLFHTGTHYGITTTNKGNTLEDPDNAGAFADVMKLMRPYMSWITKEEMKGFVIGEDIFVTGADICKGRDGRSADILYHYDGGCVIKGVKK